MVLAGSGSAALLSELDAIEGRPQERWAEVLRQLAAFFLTYADSLTTRQIELFDHVFVRLLEKVDTASLAELSRGLSDARRPPLRTTERLARDANESVSIPILKSQGISQDLLREVAQSRGFQHLLTIAERRLLESTVGEVLVQRGDAIVHRALAQNLWVQLDESAWAKLVQLAQTDKILAEQLGRRSDVPEPLRRKIHGVLKHEQMRVLHRMPHVMRAKIETTIASTDTTEILSYPTPPDYVSAEAKMAELSQKGKLNDSTVNRFAVSRQYTDVMAALALLCGAPVKKIEPLIASKDVEGLVVACKASRLNWTTTTMILKHRPGLPPISSEELQNAEKIFDSFSLSAAQRIVRF
jgi:uncharacterized protein (DUF2336 family)